jgi:transposase InsO family protein
VWVSDFTYVRSWAGFVYTAFIVDVFAQRILAWHCATTKHVELVATPLRIALWDRDRQGHTVGPDELICHSDAGSQYTAIRFTEHLALEGISPSIGSIGDAYDNALMESIKCRCRHLMAYADVWIMPTVTTSALVGTGWVGGLSA